MAILCPLAENSIYLHLHKLLRSNQTLLPCPWTFAVLHRCHRLFQGPEMVDNIVMNVILFKEYIGKALLFLTVPL